MSAVRFHQVTKRFGSVLALDALDLSIESGEFVSLLGPSGSGKTTTLNLLAGLLSADAGEIRIGDRRVDGLPPDERDIAMVFQSYALYPHMTVAENLAFPLQARRRRVPAASIESKVETVSKTLGIGHLLDRYPRELSGGQQQRVALGRAMVRDPKVFLLDEPLSNLDARLRIRMRHDIKSMHHSIGSTIVYVTHDQVEAMTMSTRVAVFNEGRLQQFAEPREIYNQPVNMFVANFVGEREINILPGRITDAGFALDDGDGTIPLPCGVRPESLREMPLMLGVRHEAVTALPASAEAGLGGTVCLIELSGPDLTIYARTARGREIACKAPSSLVLEPGQAIVLRFDPSRILYFDPRSTNAVRS